MPQKFISNSCDKFVHDQSTYIHSATVHNYRTPLTCYRWATCPPPGSSPRCSSWMARSIAVGNGNHCRSFFSLVPHDGDSSKLKWHKSRIKCPSMSFIRRCALKTQPCFMNGRPSVFCMEGGIRFTMGQLSPMKSEYSPRVFLGTHVASRGSNSAPFIWYTRHLRSGHMVTYIVKVHA